MHPWLPEFTVKQNCQRATTEELRARLHCYGVVASGSRPQLVERLLLITQAVFNLLNEWSELPRVPVDRNFPVPIARLRSAAEVNRAWAQCHGESHPAIQHDGHEADTESDSEDLDLFESFPEAKRQRLEPLEPSEPLEPTTQPDHVSLDSLPLECLTPHGRPTCREDAPELTPDY